MGHVKLFTRVRHGQVQCREEGSRMWMTDEIVKAIYSDKLVHYTRVQENCYA
jgi:hypothetical protein